MNTLKIIYNEEMDISKLKSPEEYIIRNNKPWSKEDIEYLTNNWNKKHPGNIAKMLDRSRIAITQKARKLGITNNLKRLDSKTQEKRLQRAKELLSKYSVMFTLRTLKLEFGIPIERHKLIELNRCLRNGEI